MKPIIFNGVKESKSLEGMSLINDDNYYDDRTYITNSMLGKLKESPQTLQDYLAGGSGESTSALSMGDALHKGMLEPEKYKTMVATWSERDFPAQGKTLRTKENKEWLYLFKQRNPGKCILKESEWMDVENMLASLKSKPEAMSWLDNAVYEQISLAYINGVAMKSKGDILRNDEWLVDIKSTSNISLEDFKDSCEKYGYYRQAAMYCKMFNKKKFGFLVVEKKAPYKVAFYEVSEEKMQQGWKECEDLIEQYKYYFLDDPISMRVEESILKGVL